MSMRWGCLIVVTFGVSTLVSAQVVPPPAHSPAWDTGYVAGYRDGAAAATRPALPSWPADVTYVADRTYRIAPAPAGSDESGDGSVAKPFASIGRALRQIHADRAAGTGPKLAEIAYRPDGTYAQDQIMTENDLLIDAYGAASAETRPTITGNYCPFLWLNARDVHLQNLRIAGGPEAAGNKQGSYGVYANGGDDLTMDYCEVDAFQMNVDLIGAATRVRLHHNFIANAWTTAANTMSCSGLYTECVAPDVECNVFHHNGWRAPFDMTDAALVQTMMFRHGWYESAGNGTASGGIDRFNLYLRNACTGHQCRAGNGDVQWSVFWDNGNACDVLLNPGPNNNLGGQVAHCAFFGNLTRDFACWGGGVLGQTPSDDLHDLLFAGGANSMQLPAAITIQGVLPSPAIASVRDCRGIWRTGGVSVLDRRNATISNVHIRKPGAGERVPTLLDYCGTRDDATTAELLRTHLRDSRYSAQQIIEWLGRSLAN